MNQNNEIKKLVINIEGKEIPLDIDKAKKLYESLKELFDRKIVYEPNPYPIRRWEYPHDRTWCSSDKLEIKL